MRLLLVLLCLMTLSPALALTEESEVNLYSAQKEHLIRPVLERFEAKTGITVNMTTGKASELTARLRAEGKRTPADLLLTVDIGNIYQAKQLGLLQAVDSETLRRQIPAHLRDPEGHWMGLTTRARLIFYRKGAVVPADITRYEDLANAKWRDSVLIRSSSNVYNQSLVAAMIAHHGEAKTAEWLDGLVANLARPPQGGDTDQLRALAAGAGKLAVANSYYYARLVHEDSEAFDPQVKEAVGVIFPNQAGRGAHINIRGGGVTKHATNKAHAVRLLEYLASDEAQRFFAAQNYEFPASPDVAAPEAVSEFSEFTRDTLPLETVGAHQRAAVRLMDAAGWR